jgi:hypothetical protein
MTGHVFRAGVNFDAGDDARVGDDFNKESAIFLPLADRFVLEDHAADALADTGRRDDPFTISAPGFHSLGDSQDGESFVAGGGAFIHRQKPFVVGHQLSRGVCKLRVHGYFPVAPEIGGRGCM